MIVRADEGKINSVRYACTLTSNSDLPNLNIIEPFQSRIARRQVK